jgi:UDP-N-acetylglucosamine 4,6-dehydratase
LFTKSDTTGEKDFEEFFTYNETLYINRFQNLGIIKNDLENFDRPNDYFTYSIRAMKENKSWTRQEIVDLFHYMIPGFGHKETGKYLDEKM